MRRFVVLCAALAATSFAAHAVTPGEMLPDPALEARARAITGELRCLVCQNQSIDDSNAPLARDLRLLVRERLKQGDTDEGVRSFLVARYGDFVLLKPPVGASTAILWATPFVLLALTVLVLLFKLRTRNARAASTTPAALTPDEQAKLGRLLGEDR